MRTVRHGGSGSRFLGRVLTAAIGDDGSGSGGASRTLSASWIADSAASVGSFIFFGVFAMSVVASHYAGPEPRRESIPDRAHERVYTDRPRIPQAAGNHAPALISHCRWNILSAHPAEGYVPISTLFNQTLTLTDKATTATL